MNSDKQSAKAKLEGLGQHLRDGWKKLHPVKEKHLKEVENAVRQQWEEEQAKLRDSKSHEKDSGHSH